MEYKVNINNKTYTLDTLFCKDYAGAGGLYDFALDLIKEIRILTGTILYLMQGSQMRFSKPCTS